MVALNDVKKRREKRSRNIGHGRRISAIEKIKNELRDPIRRSAAVDWKTKFNLASKVSSDYDIPIGEANQMIERVRRANQ